MKLVYQYMAILFNFKNTSNHLHPLQIGNCDSNSRLVEDEDDHGKLRLERVKTFTLASCCKSYYLQTPAFYFPCHERHGILYQRQHIISIHSYMFPTLRKKLVCQTRLKGFGDRSFAKAAPYIWNNLPHDLTRHCSYLPYSSVTLKDFSSPSSIILKHIKWQCWMYFAI